MARGRRIVVDSDSDSDFPELQDLSRDRKEQNRSLGLPASQTEDATSKSTVRTRKLGILSDTTLLRPKTDRGSSQTIFDDDGGDFIRPRRTELRTTKPRPVFQSVESDRYSDTDSMHEETTIEDFCNDDGSNFEASRISGSDEDRSSDEEFLQRSPSKLKRLGTKVKGREKLGQAKRSPSPSAQLLSEALEAQERNDLRHSGSEGDKAKSKAAYKKPSKSRDITPSDLARPLSKLNM